MKQRALLSLIFSALNASILIAQTPSGGELVGLHNLTSANIPNINTPFIGSLLHNTTNSTIMVNTTGSSSGWSAINDHFGNHIATQNVQTNGNWISGDGSNTGMFVSNSGNVGFGTNTPNEAVHIVNGGLQIDRNVYSPFFMLHRTARKTFFVGIDSESAYFSDNGVSTGGSNTLRMRIISNGNVGINNNSPSTNLVVNGNIQCVSITQVSDKKLKKNIRPLPSATRIVLKLNPVSYQYRSNKFPKHDFTDDIHFGLVAQEVEKIIPELVSNNEKGFKSVNYIGMIPFLIKSTQEQGLQIEKRNKALNTLIKEVEKAEAMISPLP